VQRRVELRVRKEVDVGLLYMWFKMLQRKPSDGQHWARDAFAAFDQVVYNAASQRENRECISRAETTEEKPADSLLRVLSKRLNRRGGSDGDG